LFKGEIEEVENGNREEVEKLEEGRAGLVKPGIEGVRSSLQQARFTLSLT